MDASRLRTDKSGAPVAMIDINSEDEILPEQQDEIFPQHHDEMKQLVMRIPDSARHSLCDDT
jgi:hypothetical protein